MEPRPHVIVPRSYGHSAEAESPVGASLGWDVNSYEEMARAHLEVESVEWEAGLPSEMTLELLGELAADLLQVEVPDPAPPRLQCAVTVLQALVEARGWIAGKLPHACHAKYSIAERAVSETLIAQGELGR